MLPVVWFARWGFERLPDLLVLLAAICVGFPVGLAGAWLMELPAESRRALLHRWLARWPSVTRRLNGQTAPDEDDRARRYRARRAAYGVNEDGGDEGPVRGMRRP